jgi:MerR family transcriptional regulator, repressor of the yfmOP operon
MSVDDPTAPVDAPYYRIEQVAARTGLTKRTLRYYEEIGLLAAPARTEGNYRLYSEADVARLEQICRLKEALGLTLSEISELMQVEDERNELRASYRQTQDPVERRAQLLQFEALVHKQLDFVERKQAMLNEMREALHQQLARFEAKRRALDEGESPTAPA